MFYKILVAIDDSDANRAVFQQALDIAKRTDACLMLMHVLYPGEKDGPILPSAYTPYYYPVISESVIRRFQEEWKADEANGLQLLQQFTQKATAVGVTTEFTQNAGEPGKLICALARDWGADLIVLGRRGRTGLSELFLGSVSNYVLHHAPCSVLTVQGKRTEAPTLASDTAEKELTSSKG
jgi:nucleotide-binding universal stress UspA family protein